MKWFRLVLGLLAAALPPTAFSQTRILCLGDSITEGGGSSPVYRPYLAEKLKAANLDVEFVGPKKDRAGLHHGGYGGKNIEQVFAEYRKFHAQHPADVVIIHSGHNHFAEEKPVPGIIRTAESIVELARRDNPDVRILLAKVIPSGKLPKYEYIPELNRQIGLLGEKLNVTVVDQATGFDWKTDTVEDKVHPNESGARKMAGRFFDALQPLLTARTSGPDTFPVPEIFRDLPATPRQALAAASTVLTYKTVDGVDLEMHLFLPSPPADNKPRPGILYIHGGGWAGGDPAVHAYECVELSRRGMVCATIRYRLTAGRQKGKFSIARSPADCLADAKSAMRFFRSRASEFSMDPDRIAAGGGSAGGHLAAALNTVDGFDDPADDLSLSAKANALVLLYPAFDLRGGWQGGINQVKKAGIDPAKFSPATLAGPSFPPTMILVGNEDPVSPPASHSAFLKRMREAGVHVELFTYAGKAHKLFDRKTTDPHFQSYLIHTNRFFQELGWIAKQPLPPLPAVEFTEG